MDFIRIAPDAFQLQTTAGETFVPLGCNYFDPLTGWAPQLWKQFDAARVREHFRIMQDLGVNAIRIFLATSFFLPEPESTPAHSWDVCDQIVALARGHNIRIDFSGPNSWEGHPPWYTDPATGKIRDYFTDPLVTRSIESFWQRLAARYANEPAIFAYDLFNEPVLEFHPAHVPLWRSWAEKHHTTSAAAGKAWGRPVRFDTLELPEFSAATQAEYADYHRFRDEVSVAWVARMAAAIRRGSRNHLVTIGTHQHSVPFEGHWPMPHCVFDPRLTAPHLDYVSLHFYPLPPWYGHDCAARETLARPLAVLRTLLSYCQVGKPVVLEEFGWYGGGEPESWGMTMPPRSEAEQRIWPEAVMTSTRDLTAGYLNWAYADTPSSRDITRYSGLVRADNSLKPWGERFSQLARELRAYHPLPTSPAVELPLSRYELLGRFEQCQDFREKCFSLSAQGVRINFRPTT